MQANTCKSGSHAPGLRRPGAISRVAKMQKSRRARNFSDLHPDVTGYPDTAPVAENRNPDR